MKRRLIHAAVAVIAMFLCAAAGLFIPALWQGVSSRDFRPQATMMALLIMIFAVVFRRVFRWHVLDFVFGLVAAECVMLCIIAHFSGFTGFELFDRVNLSWLVGMSLFVGLPWLVGLALGSLWLRLSKRHEPNA